MILLLEHAERILRAHVAAGNDDAAVAVFRRVVNERTEAMHARAQAAEGRAHKAERLLDRIIKS